MSVRWSDADLKAVGWTGTGFGNRRRVYQAPDGSLIDKSGESVEKVNRKRPPAVRTDPPVDSTVAADLVACPAVPPEPCSAFALVVPWPPTANTATRHPKAGVHYLTQAHRSFRSEVAWIVSEAMASVRGKYRMEVICQPPDRRRRDFDNIQKTLCDALVKAGAIEDDCLMRELHVTWHDWRKVETPRVIVRAQALPAAALDNPPACGA